VPGGERLHLIAIGLAPFRNSNFSKKFKANSSPPDLPTYSAQPSKSISQKSQQWHASRRRVCERVLHLGKRLFINPLAGTSGQAKNFITRTQAVRKLQISLPDFRKLCIWKGIYPREPRNKKKASASSTASTTFYYTKDIQYLLHEPLLAKFREQKTLERKISKALGRGDAHDAQRLEKNASRPEKTGKTKYTLDHVIRERYPTFIDALRDLDDCLSMLFLFANLPSTSTVPAKMIARCERLCLEFEHYLIVSHSLRKSFLSIKGIYYQATIQGQDILWLVPYKFNQRVTGDVDFRIMGTFVEFYQTLLGFVNFRLYTSLGLVYPPKFDAASDEKGAELGAFTLEGNSVGPIAQPQLQIADKSNAPDPKLQAEIDKLMLSLNTEKEPVKTAEVEDEEQPTDTIDKFEPAAPGGDILPQPSYSATDPSTLFSNFTFFLSRETPRQPLEFILRAFGCKRIGWDAVLGEGAFTHNESDPSITHQIVDRPPMVAQPEDEDEEMTDNQTAQRLRPGARVPGRIYVQPQWVWDCVNDEELKAPQEYAPGNALPPHLSPFVKKVRGQYDPSAPLAEQEREGEELEADSSDEEDIPDEDEEMTEKPKALEEIDASAAGMDVAGSSDEDSESDEVEAGGDFDGMSEAEDDESEDENTTAARERQRELEAELTGATLENKKVDPKAKAKADARKKAAKAKKEEDEELERAKMMMSRKKRKILEKMVYSNKKKDAEAETLRSKRRKIEKKKGEKA
jgi:pescadillo protein